MQALSLLLLAASLASQASAKTDLTGCTTTDISSPAGASVAWYVPDTGEICAFLDCGGGTAPPKTTVPGCVLYSGTATYTPSYLSGYIPPLASMGASSSAPAAPVIVTSSMVSSSAYASSKTAPISASATPSISTSVPASSASIPTITTAPYVVGAASNGTTPATGINGGGSTGGGLGSGGNVTGTTGSAGTGGTGGTATGGGTGIAASGTPSNSTSPVTNGAADVTQAWMGSACMVLGLGAVVFAL